MDEYLLNQLSKWILYDRLPSLARDLGISQADLSRIMIPSNTPQEQIFQVSNFFLFSNPFLPIHLVLVIITETISDFKLKRR